MKFGKQLALRKAVPQWSEYYIDYKKLKQYIKQQSIKLASSTYDPDLASKIVDEFRDLLSDELEKVDDRFHDVEADSEEELDDLNATWHNAMTEEEQKQWRERLQGRINLIEELIEFTQANVTGFHKILKKFDKHFRQQSSGVPAKAVASGPTHDALMSTANSPPVRSGSISFSVGNDSMKRTNSPPGMGSYQAQQPIHLAQRRYSMGPEGKDMWRMVMKFKFSTTEKDEMLLSRARELWRRHAPPAPSATLPINDMQDLSISESNIQTYSELDLNSVPYGRVTKIWITLIEDSLKPLQVPVLIARGVRPGPIVGMTSALHGNEVNGVRVIHRLFQTELDPEQLHGTVVAVPVANVQGFLASQRGFDGQDLNRLMPGKLDGSTPQQYAYALLDRIVRKFDYLIDLHTASKGRVNSLYVRANMLDPRTRRMATLQNPQIIVHNTSPDGSLRGSAMTIHDIPSITVEIGNPGVFQKRFVKSALLGVTNIMSNLGMIPEDHSVPEYEPVICDRSYWIFCQKGGILSVIPEVNTWVRKDEVIATIHSIFGQLLDEIRAPEDGIVVGKEVDPVASSGSRIVHLGVTRGEYAKKVEDGHL
ncbi:hypothetical protein SAICODRAFT_16043, partial [Saitoella complicata NRRL Y-17804]|uniref:SPX domain-containing protein n=1 Tax=Saitoella complicata (strain BCRC 22490 / CBS 7301 / JCM 7358 / NBRC 10748 / NRRL Y-17804) TaxID=698492 RepID=A0A0E9NHL5_SAICN